MSRTAQQQDDLWLMAAVIGGLWASIEIIVAGFQALYLL